MNILIHTDEYYPCSAACAYRQKAFAEAFAAQGDRVTVIASSTNRTKGETEPQKERIIYAPTVSMKKKTGLMRMVNNLSFAFTSVFAALRAGKADVVITTSPPPLVSISGWLIAKLKGARLVYDVRDIWPDVALEMGSFREGSFYCRVFRGITNFMYRHADIVATVSPGKVEKLRQKLAKNPDKVRLVANGFDETVLCQREYPEVVEKYALDEKFSCVYIGNIGLAQGLGALLNLAKETRHQEVQFLLFGTGAEKELLEEQARELKNVHFCGSLPHAQVSTVLRHAKLSFIPLKSAKMRDSIPTKTYESIGLGCPVLLLAEGDACRIVEESGCGRCVSPDTPEQLAGVFDEMLEHYDRITANRTRGEALMLERYSRQKAAAEFAAALKKENEEKKK